MARMQSEINVWNPTNERFFAKMAAAVLLFEYCRANVQAVVFVVMLLDKVC